MATKLEASPFIANLSMSLQEKKPFNLYTNSEIILIISGIGKSNSAMAVSYLVNKHDIKTLINTGAAGSTIDKLKIADVLQVNRIIELDRINIMNNKYVEYKLDTLELFENAALATQDKPVIELDDRKNVSKHAQLVDMEGAGFIQACNKFEVRGLVYKIVTDTPAHNSSESIIQNIKKTRDKLFKIITGVNI